MRVAQYIREKKQQFKDNRYVMERTRAEQENEKLQLEAKRAEKVAAVRRENEELMRRIEKDKLTKPSKVKAFGNGLAKVMNKARADFTDAKKQGYFKGVNHQVQSKGPDFGGSSGLSLGPTLKAPEKTRPKKKVVTYY